MKLPLSILWGKRVVTEASSMRPALRVRNRRAKANARVVKFVAAFNEGRPPEPDDMAPGTGVACCARAAAGPKRCFPIWPRIEAQHAPETRRSAARATNRRTGSGSLDRTNQHLPQWGCNGNQTLRPT